jgi:hypothetical protein
VTRSAPDDDDQSVADWDKQRIAVQLVLAGLQDCRVLAHSASASGFAHGTIAIRIGRTLLYVEDRDALLSLVAVVQEAVALEDQAFGRRHPSAYRPRSGAR